MKAALKILVVIIFCMQSAHAEARRFKIGVSAPLTGSASTYGLDIQDIVTFAKEKFGMSNYDFIFEDDKCDPKTAVTVAHKLTQVDKVDAVAGFGCSGALLAAAPIYEKSRTLTISTSASAAKISQAGDFIFRTTPSDLKCAEVLYNQVASAHKNLAMLSEQTQYAEGLRDAVLGFNQPKRIQIFSESYLSDTTDFRVMLLKLRSKNPEALFINTQTESGFLVILKQLNEIAWKPKIYGAYWPGSSAFLDVAKEQANGIVFVDLPFLKGLLNAEGEEMFAEYANKHGKLRSYEALFASTIEGMRAAKLTLESGAEPRKFLYSGQFAGLFGAYSFDSNGDIIGLTPVLKRIENQQPVALQ